MTCVNRVTLLGNLGADPEVRETRGGTTVANLSVATSRSWTTEDGDTKDVTEWHRVVAWGGQARFCDEYLRKGDRIYVEGSLRTRSYEKDGESKRVTEVKAYRVVGLERSRRSEEPAEDDFSEDALMSSGKDDLPF